MAVLQDLVRRFGRRRGSDGILTNWHPAVNGTIAILAECFIASVTPIRHRSCLLSRKRPTHEAHPVEPRSDATTKKPIYRDQKCVREHPLHESIAVSGRDTCQIRTVAANCQHGDARATG